MRPLVIAQELSLVIVLLGLLMIIVPLIDLAYRGYPSTWFTIMGFTYTALGLLVYKLNAKLSGIQEPGFLDSVVAYSLAWLVVPALAAIPLYLETGISYVNSLFESVSGFTGTGLTVMVNLEKMKKGVLFWRGLMQWVGELGFVVFVAVLMPFFWRFSYVLYRLERPVRIFASLRRTARRIFFVYTVITLTGIAICIYLGVEPLDAVVHVMTAIATGGMSNYDSNYGRVFEYAPLSIYPITALMILGGTSFTILSYLMSGELKRALENEEFKAYLALCLVFFAFSSVLALQIQSSPTTALVYGGFNALSALTTTGFNIGDVGSFPPQLKLLFTAAMIIGSMGFSTAGGIKVARLIIVLKKLKSQIFRVLTAEAITPSVKLGDEVLDEREVSGALLFVLLHLFFVFLGASLIKAVLPSRDFMDAVFEATSAVGCVGLSTGITGPTAPLEVKVVLIVLMYLGKLEYLPLITALGILALRRYKAVLPVK